MSSEAPAWPTGFGRRLLSEVDSTNAEALRRAGEISGPCWILGLRQLQGRGRRGRRWSDPEGNFAATLLLHPSESASIAALRSFVAALALADALRAVAPEPGAEIALKWPNDVLLNGGKVAGILLESAGRGGGLAHLAIGIGVNLVATPGQEGIERGALRPVSLLSETGTRLGPETFLTYLAAAYAKRERQFTDFGFAPIRIAWLARAARLGQPVTARTGREEHTGTFRDIDMTGALLLDTPQGRASIAAAEIFF